MDNPKYINERSIDNMTTIIPVLYHKAGQTPMQDYKMTMLTLEKNHRTDTEDGYNVNWRRDIRRMFDAKGNPLFTRQNDLRSHLQDIKLFQGVVEVWAEFTCPCGEVDYVSWELDDVDTESFIHKCPDCGNHYELTMQNVHTVRWIKE